MTSRQRARKLMRARLSLVFNLFIALIGAAIVGLTSVDWLGWIMMAAGSFMVVGEFIQLTVIKKQG